MKFTIQNETQTGVVAARRRRRTKTRAGRVSRLVNLQLPTASVTHFLVKLVFAAPLSFFAAAEVSQDFCASDWHFFMKLFSAAPASFFSVAWP
jgi:hypothetical protein